MAQRKPADVSKADEIQASSVIRKIDLNDLEIDRSYQREPSQQLVNTIAEDWDAVSSELILVSDRGEDSAWKGRYYTVNGQHRTLAARKRGIKKIDARIIDLTMVDEPAKVEAMFRLRTNVRMGDKPLERFKAQVVAGNEESIAIVKILDRFDTEVNLSPSQEAGINPIAAIEKIYRADGDGKLLVETLQLLKDVFGVIGGKTTNQATLNATAWFIIKHSDESDRGRIVERLQAAGFSVWDRKARSVAAVMGGSLWLNYYRAMIEIYNERLTSRRLEYRSKGSQNFGGSAKRSAFGGF